MATLFPAVLFGQHSYVIGASGAVMGMLAAFVMLDPERQFFFLPIPFPITATGLLVIMVVLNLVTSLSGTSTTSVTTHFGGMAMGWLLMRAIPKYNAWQRERARDIPRKPKTGPNEKLDKIGEAVDNIFNFDNKRRH